MTAGAHKAVLGPGAWPGPGDAFTMSNRQGVGLSVDIDAMLASGHLQHVEMAAGDILIFPSAASVHVRPSAAQLPLLPPPHRRCSDQRREVCRVGLWVCIGALTWAGVCALTSGSCMSALNLYRSSGLTWAFVVGRGRFRGRGRSRGARCSSATTHATTRADRASDRLCACQVK